MTIIICPGIHAPELTKSFIQECLNQDKESFNMEKPTDILIFPEEGYLTLSTFHTETMTSLSKTRYVIFQDRTHRFMD